MKNLQMAANEIEKIKKEWKTKINEMKKHGSALRDIKKMATKYRDRIEVIREMFPGEFESAY